MLSVGFISSSPFVSRLFTSCIFQLHRFRIGEKVPFALQNFRNRLKTNCVIEFTSKSQLTNDRPGLMRDSPKETWRNLTRRRRNCALVYAVQLFSFLSSPSSFLSSCSAYRYSYRMFFQAIVAEDKHKDKLLMHSAAQSSASLSFLVRSGSEYY